MSGNENRLVVVDAQYGLFLERVQGEGVGLYRFPRTGRQGHVGVSRRTGHLVGARVQGVDGVDQDSVLDLVEAVKKYLALFLSHQKLECMYNSHS